MCFGVRMILCGKTTGTLLTKGGASFNEGNATRNVSNPAWAEAAQPSASFERTARVGDGPPPSAESKWRWPHTALVLIAETAWESLETPRGCARPVLV